MLFALFVKAVSRAHLFSFVTLFLPDSIRHHRTGWGMVCLASWALEHCPAALMVISPNHLDLGMPSHQSQRHYPAAPRGPLPCHVFNGQPTFASSVLPDNVCPTHFKHAVGVTRDIGSPVALALVDPNSRKKCCGHLAKQGNLSPHRSRWEHNPRSFAVNLFFPAHHDRRGVPRAPGSTP